jgi:hypothetical protein
LRLRILLLIVFGSATIGCAPMVSRSRDLVFSVTGVVTTEGGAGLEGAEVTLEVNGPVYQAITPVKTARRQTDNAGGFVFMFISHASGVGHNVTVRKAGFEPETLAGSAPPAGHHTIRLRRVVVSSPPASPAS